MPFTRVCSGDGGSSPSQRRRICEWIDGGCGEGGTPSGRRGTRAANVALRRAQQLRRHRDPQFQRFASTVSVPDAMKLFGEVLTKVPVLYADREKATPQMEAAE